MPSVEMTCWRKLLPFQTGEHVDWPAACFLLYIVNL